MRVWTTGLSALGLAFGFALAEPAAAQSQISSVCGVTGAATAPASQYSPRVCDSMATIPIGAMAIGRRARKPAAAKPLAPGARKISA